MICDDGQFISVSETAPQLAFAAVESIAPTANPPINFRVFCISFSLFAVALVFTGPEQSRFLGYSVLDRVKEALEASRLALRRSGFQPLAPKSYYRQFVWSARCQETRAGGPDDDVLFVHHHQSIAVRQRGLNRQNHILEQSGLIKGCMRRLLGQLHSKSMAKAPDIAAAVIKLPNNGRHGVEKIAAGGTGFGRVNPGLSGAP